MYSSLEGAFEFCWSSCAGEHNTLVKSTRRNVELNKFGRGTPWLPDILCKQRFMPSVWDFCHWVADACSASRNVASSEGRGETAVQLKVDICEAARLNAWTTFIGVWKISDRPYDSPYQVRDIIRRILPLSHNCLPQSNSAKQAAFLHNFKVFPDEQGFGMWSLVGHQSCKDVPT